jgi:hypothetical protein
MTKDKFIKIYMWMSIVFMLGYLATIGNFLGTFPSDATDYPYGFNGTTEVNLWKAVFSNYAGDIEILNVPLIVSGVFLLVTVLVVVYAFKGDKLKDQAYGELLIYDTILALMLVVSTLVYMYLIPDIVNGVIAHKFLWTEMPRVTDDVVKVFNFGYVISIIYIVLNFGLLYHKRERKFQQKEQVFENEDLLL